MAQNVSRPFWISPELPTSSSSVSVLFYERDNKFDAMDFLHQRLSEPGDPFEEQEVSSAFSSASKVKASTKTVFSKKQECKLSTWTDEQVRCLKAINPEDALKTSKQIAEVWTNQLNPSFKHGMLTEDDKEIIRKDYLSKLEEVEFNKDRLSPTIYADISKEISLETDRVRFFILHDQELQIRMDQRRQEITPGLDEQLAGNKIAAIKSSPKKVAKGHVELTALHAARKSNKTAKNVFVTKMPFTSKLWTSEQIAFIKANVTKEKIKMQRGFWGEFLFENQVFFKDKTARQLRALWDGCLNPSFVYGPLTKKGKVLIRDLYFERLKNVNFVHKDLPPRSVADISKKLEVQTSRVRRFLDKDKVLKRMIATKNADQKMPTLPYAKQIKT